MIFSQFEKKMIAIAKEKQMRQYSDMPQVFCFAEFGESDHEMETMLEEFLKSGKKPVSKYVKTAAQSINKVWKHIYRQYSEDIGDAETWIKFKKYTVVFNQIDGMVKNDPFYTYAFATDLMKALETIMPLTNFNQGEWDMKIYRCSSDSKIIQKYGYYHEIRHAECIFEFSYMSDLFKKIKCNPATRRITINNETFEV